MVKLYPFKGFDIGEIVEVGGTIVDDILQNTSSCSVTGFFLHDAASGRALYMSPIATGGAKMISLFTLNSEASGTELSDQLVLALFGGAPDVQNLEHESYAELEEAVRIIVRVFPELDGMIHLPSDPTNPQGGRKKTVRKRRRTARAVRK